MTYKAFTIIAVTAVSILLYSLYTFMLPSPSYVIRYTNNHVSAQEDDSVSHFFVRGFVPKEKTRKIYKFKGITESPFPSEKYQEQFPNNLVLGTRKDGAVYQYTFFFDNEEKIKKFIVENP
ncbi:MAG: hypothetical protein PF572_05380 [Patescibacteria group bacterium]|jgi:hypothetical protein|nr:hypothetical protein [Patescibacteria group bacterium]